MPWVGSCCSKAVAFAWAVTRNAGTLVILISCLDRLMQARAVGDHLVQGDSMRGHLGPHRAYCGLYCFLLSPEVCQLDGCSFFDDFNHSVSHFALHLLCDLGDVLVDRRRQARATSSKTRCGQDMCQLMPSSLPCVLAYCAPPVRMDTSPGRITVKTEKQTQHKCNVMLKV